jgi:hypothetical protein
MHAIFGRRAATITDRRGRRRTLASVLSAAGLLTGLLATTAAPASAATCPSGAAAVQSTSYDIVHLVGPAEINVPDLTGHVQQGDVITVSFTIPPLPTGCSSIAVDLVSYRAPGPTFDRSTADQQRLFNSNGADFAPGRHNYPDGLRVDVPPCYFQVDLITGRPMDPLGGTNGFYSDQGRLVDAANGGTMPCSTGVIS